MMPGNLFQLELAAALGDRRRLALRIGISILLALPFIFVAMPTRARVPGVTMVVLFTSFFGAAVHHARLRADGRLARLCLLPMRRGVLWLDLVLASMLSRLAPALVVVFCFVLVNGRRLSGVALAGVAGLLCAALLALTLLGIVVGRLARSNGEVHLLGALAAGAVALASGVMPLPERLTWMTGVTAWNPVARLLDALNALAAGRPSPGGGQLGLAMLVLVLVAATAGQRWIAGHCRLAPADGRAAAANEVSPRTELRSPKPPLEA